MNVLMINTKVVAIDLIYKFVIDISFLFEVACLKYFILNLHLLRSIFYKKNK